MKSKQVTAPRGNAVVLKPDPQTPVCGGIALARLLTGMVHVNDQTVNDLPQCPMGGLGQSGNGSRFGSLNRRDEFTQWPWLTASGSAALYPV